MATKSELKYAFIVGGFYLCFGVLWILLSDQLLEVVAKTDEQYREIQRYKGLVFVLLSTLLIFVLVLFYYKRYLSYYKKYKEIHKEDDMIFQNFPIGLAIVGLDRRFIKVNKEMVRIFGFSLDEILQMGPFDLTVSEDKEQDFVYEEGFLSGTRTSYSATRKLSHKSGQKIWCRVSVMLMRTMENQPKYFLISVNNINREFEINERMRKMNEELVNAQRIGNFGHWQYDLNADKLFLSAQAKSIVGLNNEGAVNRADFMGLLDSIEKRNFETLVCRALKEETRFSTVIPVKAENGTVKFLNIEAEIIHLEKGTTLKGSVKDVTEIMRLLEEKKAFAKNLVNWAFMLSHEMRKPVSSMLGLLNLYEMSNTTEQDKEAIFSYLKAAGKELDTYSKKLAYELYETELLLNNKDRK